MKGNGFTLIELLAAMAAGGLLLALLGYMTGMLGREAGHARADPFDQIADAAPILGGLLEDIPPAGGDESRFEGAPDHLIADVPPPIAWRDRGPMRLELVAAKAPDGVALDVTITPKEDGRSGRSAKTDRLVHGLRSIDFSYRDKSGEETTARPRLIVISFVTKAREKWDLAIEPRLNAPSGCRFDAISLTCRP